MKTNFGLFLTLLIAIVSYCNAARLNVSPLSEELVRFVNNHPDSTWKAALTNRFSSIEDAKILLGALLEDPKLKQLRRPTITHEDKTLQLSESFDAREAWPFCPSIGHIRDQSSCGSCWALGAVEAMSDRICIHKSTHLNKSLSARDLMSCCDTCGYGCEGGYLGPSWDYWMRHGIVTGGDYNDTTTCLPYPFPQCQHHSKGPYADCSSEMYDTPTCVNVCKSDYHTPYRYDLIKGKSSYNVQPRQEAIMAEIQLNGPVEAAFDVYSDFLNYKSGVYKHLNNDYLGGHAIRILGWGVEDDVPYWLCANSWNDAWGDKGYFKILRGSNECGIENDVVAGLI